MIPLELFLKSNDLRTKKPAVLWRPASLANRSERGTSCQDGNEEERDGVPTPVLAHRARGREVNARNPHQGDGASSGMVGQKSIWPAAGLVDTPLWFFKLQGLR